MTCNPAWTVCLLAHLTIVTNKSSNTYDKKGSGFWNFLSPGDLATPRGLENLVTYKVKPTALLQLNQSCIFAHKLIISVCGLGL